MSIAMAVTVELLLPSLGFMDDNPYVTLIVVIVFILQLVIFSSLFAWYFTRMESYAQRKLVYLYDYALLLVLGRGQGE